MNSRFPEPVATVLAAAGWHTGRNVHAAAAAMIERISAGTGRHGARLPAGPAARDALCEFGGLRIGPDGPGCAVRRRPFELDPTSIGCCAQTLADASRIIGAPLFPIGLEGDHDAILTIDEPGRVFALDHAGEWHLGDSMDAALVTLITGAAPARVNDHGAW